MEICTRRSCQTILAPETSTDIGPHIGLIWMVLREEQMSAVEASTLLSDGPCLLRKLMGWHAQLSFSLQALKLDGYVVFLGDASESVGSTVFNVKISQRIRVGFKLCWCSTVLACHKWASLVRWIIGLRPPVWLSDQCLVGHKRFVCTNHLDHQSSHSISGQERVTWGDVHGSAWLMLGSDRNNLKTNCGGLVVTIIKIKM